MGIYENVKKAAELRHTTISKIEKDLSLPRSSIAKFNAHTPAADKLLMIADYLNVSVESLIRTPEAQKVIDRIKTKLSAIGPAAGSMWDDMQKDPAFKDHVELLWSLPPEQRSEIYNYIKYHYYKTEEKNDEPLHA